MKAKLKGLLLALGVLFAAAALLCCPQAAAAGAKNGLSYCLEILIPSLFPFMVLSVFVVKSGLAAELGRIAAPLCQLLFALPGCAAAAIMMSMVGGYPVGARAAASLVEQGELTREQGDRMLCFCINAGPAFVISVVGAGLLHRTAAGFLVLAAQLLSCITLGILSSIGLPRNKAAAKKGIQKPPVSHAFIASAMDASQSILSMCAFVILFASVLAILRLFIPQGAPSVLLSGLMEVTGGCYDAAKSTAPLWFFALVIGWGGLCVQFQVLSSAVLLRPSLPRFVLFRLLHGILASLFTSFFCYIFPEVLPAFSTTVQPLQACFSGSAPACAALLFLCVLLLLQINVSSEDYKSAQTAGF